MKYLSPKKGFLGIDAELNRSPQVIVVPFGLEKTVSYGGYETESLSEMEQFIMDHHSYNYSQMHKILVRKEYYFLKSLL